MSITLLIGLLVLAIVVVAAAGVWRARGQGPASVQSSLMMLAVTVAAALVVYFLIKRRL
jgi:hypothetical protein